jgi:ABC-2 type transport system permease protein
MDSLIKLTYIDMKLYFRNTVAIFFTLAFPLLMLVLFGGIYGNQPADIFGGYGSVDITVPGYIATIVIGTTAFMGLPMDLSTQRQLGVLRRMRATPLHPGMVLASKLISNLIISLIGMVVLIIAGRVIFQTYLPVNWPTVLLGILLISVSLYALGLAMASLVRSANAARAVSFAVFFPMMFLSGGTLPGQFLPETMRLVGKALPLTYSVNLLHDLWFGLGWDLTAVLVLAGFMAAGVILSVRFFKWE